MWRQQFNYWSRVSNSGDADMKLHTATNFLRSTYHNIILPTLFKMVIASGRSSVSTAAYFFCRAFSLR